MEFLSSVYFLLTILLTSLINSTRTHSSDNRKNYFKIKPEIIHSKPFDIQQEELKRNIESESDDSRDYLISKELYNIDDKLAEEDINKTKQEQDEISASLEEKHNRRMKILEGQTKRIDKIRENEKEEFRTNFEEKHKTHMKILERQHTKIDKFRQEEDDRKQKLKEQYKIEEELKTNSEESDFDFESSQANDKLRRKSKNSLEKYLNEYDTIPIIDYRTKIHIGDQFDELNYLRKKSPEDLGLKSSSDLPFPDLIENTNKLYDPRETDLNRTILLKKLGNYFDNNFMSINKPQDNYSKNNILQLNNLTRNKNGKLISINNIPNYLNKINFKYIYLPDGSKIRTRISLKLKRKMIQFLQTYTKCTVNYKWKDLGIRFWPRYLKSGFCVNQSVSCSIPPGMTCKPDENQYKTILRYHCNKKTSACSWRNVDYPIVASCSCACP